MKFLKHFYISSLSRIYIFISIICIVLIFVFLLLNICPDNTSIIQGISGILLFSTILAMVDNMNLYVTLDHGRNLITQMERRIINIENTKYKHESNNEKFIGLKEQLDWVLCEILKYDFSEYYSVVQSFETTTKNRLYVKEEMSNLSDGLKLIRSSLHYSQNTQLRKEQNDILNSMMHEFYVKYLKGFNEKAAREKVDKISSFEKNLKTVCFFDDLKFLLDNCCE